ncbi:Nicotinamidase-related amidase [Atopomonas hussainii]|uniref:Nicotinamidase-related amidase n=1 Tax=Atopomonas hussainii TaxID=1429083 RepID=A0A1H7N6M6_9GAMM|nr:isochorismatase family protein [Atopomonas hussainii]SEL18565.1 Nicotinamidase-related amidase [Atopomonas hussainii]
MQSALLVIDVQNGIFAHNPPPYADETLDNINQLIGNARDSSTPIVFIQHEIPGVLLPDTDPWQLAAKLNLSHEDQRLRKQTADSFQNTTLKQRLDEYGVQHLIICGYASDFCIDRTAFAAASQGYRVSLISDAHTTHSKPHAEAATLIAHHNFTLSKHPLIEALTTQDHLQQSKQPAITC